jgi:basic amino acid/polyamine antiporter, APA family
MSTDKLERRLDFNDMFFTGVSYMIGAGIFTLMPFIIKYGGKNAWLAFIIGGIISIMTGLSFARLNFQYPVNDAEYSWIREIFKGKNEKEPNSAVNWFAKIVIWVVGIMGIFAKSTIALGLAEFIGTYNLGIPKHVITFFALGLPTLINSFGVKHAANVAKTVITVVIAAFLIIIASVSKFNKHIGDNKMKLDVKNLPSILRASFITIFAFTGFQSVVQLSEETTSRSIIPKSITASVIFTTIFYALLIVSVIGITGLKKAQSTVYPISEAYNVIFGAKGRNVVTILSIITMFSTLVIGILGVSRLFQKLSVKGIAPKYLSKLVSIDSLFRKSENYENNESESQSESDNNSMFDRMPIPALLTIFALAFALTFVKGGVLELMANATNSMLFFIFSTVNLLVIVNYFKTRNDKDQIKSEDKTIQGFLKMFPWYAFIGFALALIFLVISPQYYKLK